MYIYVYIYIYIYVCIYIYIYMYVIIRYDNMRTSFSVDTDCRAKSLAIYDG